MEYVIDLGFTQGTPARFGGDDGGVRMSGEDADDVIDALCERMNKAIALISDHEDACRICAVLDPEKALTHGTADHTETV